MNKSLLGFTGFILLCAIAAGPASGAVKQWEPSELSFTAAGSHNWYAFPLQVTFTHQGSGTQLTLDGYWCGGNTWKVRFAPTKTGTWDWSSSSSDSGLNGHSGSIDGTQPSSSDISGNPNYRGHLKVSADGRHLEYADGTPFFWIGDTCWHISDDRCGVNNGNFYTYVDNRKSKKFSLIQIQYYSHGYYNEGGYPFPDNTGTPGNGDYNPINADFFHYVDIRMQYLWEQGFPVAGHPRWLSEVVVTLVEAKRIHRYLLARYGAYNTVWSLSGEYQFSRDNTYSLDCPNEWKDLGNFIQSHNPYEHPVTIHPTYGAPDYISGRVFEDYSSSGDFHNESWLDLNWIQTYVFIEDVSESAYVDYCKSPVKPVIMAEPCYEYGRPGGWAKQEYTEVDDYLVRLQAWSALLNGACGHTYGASGVWQFYDPGHPQPGSSSGGNAEPWYEAIDGEGGADMQHVYDFFTDPDLDWTALVPHGDWVRVNGSAPSWPGKSDFSPPHCAADENKNYIIYIPEGNSGKTIQITHLNQNTYTAQWFNPRTGGYSSISSSPDGVDQWTLPSRPDGNDWVACISSSGGGANTAPQVNAGTDRTVILPASVNLDGTVSDDGLPNPPAAVTVTWSKQSGPGTVTFGDAGAVDTTASFSEEGTYVLRLTADDGELSAWDEAVMNVTETSGSRIPQDNWTLVYADSEETSGEDGAAVNAFDGNTGTFWHTKWKDGSDPQPHEIQINLGAVYDVSGIAVLPRQDGGDNGRIRDYEFHTSADGNTWTMADSGTFADSASEQASSFAEQAGVEYVRLRSLSAYDNDPWTVVAEINVIGEGSGSPPVVSITAENANASEDGGTGMMRVTRTGGTTGSLGVSLLISGNAINGTDYNTVSSTVNIPAGSSSADIVITPVDDTAVEGTEDVILTIAGSADYDIGSPSSATVTIVDNDQGAAEELLQNPGFEDNFTSWGGYFQNRSITTAAEHVHSGGKAAKITTDPETYQYISQTVNAEAGKTYRVTAWMKTVNVTGQARLVAVFKNSSGSDLYKENFGQTAGTHQYEQKNSSDIAAPSGTAKILLMLWVNEGTGDVYFDNISIKEVVEQELPHVSISAVDDSASEDGGTGTFRISRTGDTSAALAVSLSISGSADNGVDYDTVQSTATISAGSSSADIVITPVDDTAVEGTEDVILTIAGSSDYNIGSPSSATVAIDDNDGGSELPEPWQNADFGSPSHAGSAAYDGGYFDGTFTVEGGGADIWGSSDSFHYVYQTFSGDGEIRARVHSIGNTHDWAKAGVMVRETMDAGSKHAMMILTAGKGMYFQRRVETGGTSASTTGAAAPQWVKIVRAGDTFTGFASASGEAGTWTEVGSIDISMSADVYIGMAVTSHDDSVLCTAQFNYVQVSGIGGLAALWEFEEGRGTSASDSSGNDNTGSLEGSASWDTGKVGAHALSLNGDDSYMQVEDAPGLDTGSGDFTYALWVKRERTGQREDLITKKDLAPTGNDVQHDISFMIQNDDTVRLYLKEGDETYSVITTGTVPAEGWVHVAVARSGGSIVIYIGGAHDGTGNSTFDFNSDGPLRIGANRAAGMTGKEPCSFPLAGCIDDVYIYSRALSEPEIQGLAAGSSHEAEAEGNTLGGTAVIIHKSLMSGGMGVGWIGGGAENFLQFNSVYAPAGGTYTLHIDYISGVERTAYLSANGGAGEEFTFPDTGDWNTPGTMDVTLYLEEGVNTVRFYNNSDMGPDIDRIVVE